jgi:hypothetical protein
MLLRALNVLVLVLQGPPRQLGINARPLATNQAVQTYRCPVVEKPDMKARR